MAWPFAVMINRGILHGNERDSYYGLLNEIVNPLHMKCSLGA